MQYLRTPDDRFQDLPGYSFEPHYVEIPDGEGGTLRVHHLDEGPADAAPILLMHGEPAWSYLYRKMIPALVAAGHRVIAPDLVGFGRSDKPTEQTDYTYRRHVDWMAAALFDQLDLRNITYFGQDWGGLIGLRLVARAPERYARVVVGNTGLPSGGQLSPEFLAWQEYSRTSPTFPIGNLVSGGCKVPLSDAEIAAYTAPFPDDSYTAGARIFPSLVPLTADDEAATDNKAAWEILKTFDRPFVCAWSDGDPMTRGADARFLRDVPGTAGQPHLTVTGAGHFLQEDKPEVLTAVLLDLIAATA